MALRPYSATLQKAYRDTLGTPGAPEVIDDGVPVTPVAIVATSALGSAVAISDGTDTLAVNSDGSINVQSSAGGFSVEGSGQTIVSNTNGKAGTAITAGTGVTIRTVTASKDAYITSFSIGQQSATSAVRWELRDGGSGGTLIYGGECQQVGSVTSNYVFPTPIKFGTDIWLDISSNETIIWAYSGWEQ